jgi:hypothetical protein
MTVAELAEVIEVQRLVLHPGERLLVQLQRAVTKDEFEHIADLLKDKLHGIEVLVVGPEFSFKVVGGAEVTREMALQMRDSLRRLDREQRPHAANALKASTETSARTPA